MKKSDTQDVRAEVVGPVGTELVITSMEPGAEIVANFDALKAHILSIVADYDGMTLVLEDVPTAKKNRAYLNGLSKSLDQRRLDAKKLYMRPVDAFEAKVRELIAPIHDASNLLDEQIKAFEAEAKADKRAEIVKHWEEYAGALADAIPFETIEDASWLNQSESLMTVFAKLEKIVERIAADEATLTDLSLSHPIEAKAELLATLDLSKAIARSKTLDAQEERARALEAEKAAIAAARKEPKAVGRDYPDPTPDALDMPEPVCVEPEISPGRFAWLLTFTCTRSQLALVLADLKGRGITGKAVRA